MIKYIFNYILLVRQTKWFQSLNNIIKKSQVTNCFVYQGKPIYTKTWWILQEQRILLGRCLTVKNLWELLTGDDGGVGLGESKIYHQLVDLNRKVVIKQIQTPELLSKADGKVVLRCLYSHRNKLLCIIFLRAFFLVIVCFSLELVAEYPDF